MNSESGMEVVDGAGEQGGNHAERVAGSVSSRVDDRGNTVELSVSEAIDLVPVDHGWDSTRLSQLRTDNGSGPRKLLDFGDPHGPGGDAVVSRGIASVGPRGIGDPEGSEVRRGGEGSRVKGGEPAGGEIRQGGGGSSVS